MTDSKTVNDKAKKPTEHDEIPSEKLSQHATKPGDAEAIQVAKTQRDVHQVFQKKLQEAGLLPSFAIESSGERSAPKPEVRAEANPEAKPAGSPEVKPEAKPEAKPAALDQKTLDTKAQELHEALNQRKWLGLASDADTNKVMAILGPLNAADRAALEKTYHDKFDKDGAPDSLRREMKDKLSDYDFRRSESALNAPDGRTNDAGALMTALTHAKDDKDRGNAEVRAVLQTLNTKQLAQLDEDFKAQYGKSYTDALKDSGDLTQATKDALPILEQGVDKRSSDDLLKLAKIGIENNDPRLFSEAIRGDSPEAVAARKAIMSDETLKNQIAERFMSKEAIDYAVNGGDVKTLPFEKRVDQVALDYLQEGRISLKTITEQDTGKWIFNNKENIELAAKNASEKERNDFAAGHDLAASGKAPANETEKQQLDYYNKIHDAFKQGGNEREVSIWEDQLTHGKETIVSQMAKTYDEGFLFGLGSGTNKNEMMTAVENLSKEDWERLKGPDGAKFREQINNSLKTYADQGEQDRINALLDQKLSKDNYEEASKIHRNLQDTIADNKGSVFLGMGTSYDGKNIVSKFTNMTPEDAAKYKNDPEFKKQIDDFVNENLNNSEKLLANRMLRQVEATGQPPKPDAIDTVLTDSVNGAKSQQLLADAEKALQDPELRARLNKPDDQLSDEDRRIKSVISSAIMSATYAGSYPSEGGPDPALAAKMDQYSKSLFETGRLTVEQKQELGFDTKDLLPAIAAAPQAEKEAAMKNLTAEQQQLVSAISSNSDGKPDLADRIRTMAIGVGGEPTDFKEELGKLSFADRQALKDEYARKFNKDVDADFLEKVKDPEKSAYTNLLRPSESDGRQTYYDNYHKMLESESGFSADGSKLTLEKANDMYAASLEEYQKVCKTLPPERQKALDEYFGSALEQYKDSKAKLAEIVVDATITAAALAATPFTGGASLALVIGIAATSGAAFRVAAMKVIEGNDFDGSAQNIIKQVVIGGTSAALNFVGAGAVEGLAANVSGKVVADVAATAGKDILTTAGKDALERGLPKLLENGGKRVSEEEVGALISKVAPNATAAEREALKKAITEKVAEVYPQEEARLAEAVANRTRAEAAKTFGREVATNAGIGAASNIGSEIVVAPFNEKGIDWDNLKSGALTGLAIGAVMPMALHGVLKIGGASKAFITNVTRDADGLSINPKNITEPVTFRNKTTGEVRTIEPGKGEPLKLTNDWQPESGGKPVPSDAKLRDTQGKPVVLELSSGSDTMAGGSGIYSHYELTVGGQKIPFDKQSVVLGRNSGSDVVNPTSTVSGRHAEIRFTEDGAKLRDLNSTNGTYINGRKMAPGEEVTLRPGDRVQLGPETMPYVFGMKQDVNFNLQIGKSEYQLKPGQEVPIGRGKNGVENGIVSSDHAAMGRDGNGYYIVDHSRNGTYVTRDGKDIKIKSGERFYLTEGDEVGLGAPVKNGGERLKLSPEARVEVVAPKEVKGGIPPEALRQSNDHGRYNETSERIQDGWSSAGGGTRFNADGSFNNSTRPAMVIDRQNDPVLRAALDEAKAKFGHLPPRERAEALTKWAQEKLKPASMNENQLDAWYSNFNDEHAGERIYFGQFLTEGKGVCSQQAILLKLAADEFPDMHCTLIRGNSGGGTSLNHAWTEFTFGNSNKPLVFDPRQKIFGESYDSGPRARSHTPGRDINALKGRPNPVNYALGDKVAYDDSNGWKVIGVHGDNLIISHGAVKTTDANSLAAWNGNKPIVIGQKYRLRRSSGAIDDGWELTGRNPDGSLQFYKPDSVVETVPRDQVSKPTK